MRNRRKGRFEKRLERDKKRRTTYPSSHLPIETSQLQKKSGNEEIVDDDGCTRVIVILSRTCKRTEERSERRKTKVEEGRRFLLNVSETNL